MEWVVALCLSVPLAAAIVAATVYLSRQADRVAAASAADRLIAVEALKEIAQQFTKGAYALAEAHVKSARYTSGFTKPKVKRTEEDDDPHPFDLWMADGGSSKDEKVQWRVEWALNRLRGEDTEQGDVAKAEKILAEDAPGYLASMRRWINRQARRKG